MQSAQNRWRRLGEGDHRRSNHRARYAWRAERNRITRSPLGGSEQRNVLSGDAIPTLYGWRSRERCLQRYVVLLKPYRGRHPGPGQRKERLSVFAVVSSFRPRKALVRIGAHFLWGHDAISFAIMTPPISETLTLRKSATRHGPSFNLSHAIGSSAA